MEVKGKKEKKGKIKKSYKKNKIKKAEERRKKLE